MVTDGDQAPDFTAPLAHGDGDVGSVTLSACLGDGPVVLAFFPGVFTSTCTHEMNTFQARLGEFDDAGASVYGVSVDSPFAQNEFREQLGLSFGLISDANREIIENYDVSMEWEKYGLKQFPKRAVFVLNDDGHITYAWVGDNPGVEPDYDEVVEAVEAVTS